MSFTRKEHRFSGIYLITNKVNGKIYVGQAVDLYERYRSHKKSKKNTRITNALKEFGIQNFVFSVLEKVEGRINLNSREQYWMEFLKSYDENIGYNMCRYAFYPLGHCEEVRKKMSENMKGKMGGEKNPFYGKNHTEESKRLISEVHKGSKHSEQAKKKMSISRKGKKQSPDHARKRVESMRRNGSYVKSEETLRKMSESRLGQKAWNKGIPRTEETKIKIIEKIKLAYQNGFVNPMLGRKRPDLAERNRLHKWNTGGKRPNLIGLNKLRWAKKTINT